MVMPSACVLSAVTQGFGLYTSRKQEYIDLADVRWMREKWRELMARTHGDFSPPLYRQACSLTSAWCRIPICKHHA